MTEPSNGWRFQHGLDRDFMEKLKQLAEADGWFADVLADPDLIIGIRNKYLNVYWRGQSLFKIEPNGKSGEPKVSTHPKYLVDPKLSRPVGFDGKVFKANGIEALIKNYEGPDTLKKLKQAAKLYCGKEKEGVHTLIRANANVIDTEVAFNNKGTEDEEERLIPRIDIACLEEGKDAIRLRFWEAKLYENHELRAVGDTEPPVLSQVRQYRKLVELHRAEMIDSYKRVAENLVEIAGWADPKRNVRPLVECVGRGANLTIDDTPSVGLVIFGFSEADKRGEQWKRDMPKLEREPNMPLLRKGEPIGLKLSTSH